VGCQANFFRHVHRLLAVFQSGYGNFKVAWFDRSFQADLFGSLIGYNIFFSWRS
jgi:hypothetical protein